MYVFNINYIFSVLSFLVNVKLDKINMLLCVHRSDVISHSFENT
jgi:hypothetical protein